VIFDWSFFYLFSLDGKVLVPELVTSGQLSEGALVQDVHLLGRSIFARLDVSQPRFQRMRIPQQLLFKWKI
jgi:hypothetical protein